MPLSSTPKYKLWRKNLEINGIDVHNVEEVWTRYRSDGDLLFGLVMLDASTPEGDKIPPVCLHQRAGGFCFGRLD